MNKLTKKIFITGISLLLLSCYPETSIQYKGEYQYSGPNPANKILWDYLLESKITTTPIMWQKGLYMLVGGSNGRLYAFDYDNGKIAWTNDYNTSVNNTPAIYDDKAFFGLEDGTFYCLNIKTGEQLWKFTADSAITSEAVTDKSGIYFGTENGSLYSLDYTGTLKYKSATGAKITASPLIYKNNIYFGSNDGNFYSINKKNGSKEWTFKTNGKIVVNPIAENGRIFVTSDDKNLYALNSKNGNFLWSFDLPEKTNSTPSINPNRDNIYVASNKKLYIIKTKSGKKINEIELTSEIDTPIININGMLYLTGNKGDLYCIDESNSMINWSFKGFGNKTTAPYLFNGIVHYGTDEGIFYAIGRIEKNYTYAPIIERTNQAIVNIKGNTQFRMSYNIPSGKVSNGNYSRLYNLTSKSTTSMAFENDFLYLGAGNELYSLRTDSDLIRWTLKLNGTIDGSPAIAGNTLYYGTTDKYIYAISADNKDYMYWRYETGGEIHSSPFISNEVVYVGSDDKSIYGINKSGQLVTIYSTGGKVRTMPIVYKDNLYSGSYDGYFYSFNKNTGINLWKFKTENPIKTSPIAINDTLFFSSNKKLYAVDTSGNKEWEFSANGEILSSPAVYENKIFFGSKDKKVYALDFYTGKKVWEFNTNGEIIAPPSVVDGYVYIGSKDKNLYALSAETGEKKWSFLAESEINDAPLVIDGGVYFNSGNKVYVAR